MVAYMAAKLSEMIAIKRSFNPSNDSDRKLAFEFLKKKQWNKLTQSNTCPFFCEWPYLDIPSMLQDKIVKYYSDK